MWKIKKFSRNKILTILLLLGVTFSVVTVVFGTQANPGHDLSTIGGATVGGILYGSATDVVSSLADVAAGSYLRSGGAGVAPVWSTMTLPNTVAAGDLLYASAINVLSALAKGTANQFLRMDGTGTNVTWSTFTGSSALLDGSLHTDTAAGTVARGDIITGQTATPKWTRLAKGTANQVLSMDGTATDIVWATPTGGGDMVLASAQTNSGLKTFNDATLGLRNVANTFTSLFTNTNTAARTYTLPDVSGTVLTSGTAVTVAQGGTGLGTLTTGNVILGAGTGNVTFVAPGTSGNLLQSNGTTWTSAAPSGVATMTTITTQPASGLGTGANAAVAMTSLTTYKVGLFNIPYNITVNQLAYNVGAVTTAGTMRLCVYNEAGTTKSIDVTDVPTAGVNTVAVGAVALTPGNYYIAMGCGTTCSNTIYMYTSTANTMVNTSAVPAGKKVYEGTVTMTSGTCNATLPAITGVISSGTVVRLDN